MLVTTATAGKVPLRFTGTPASQPGSGPGEAARPAAASGDLERDGRRDRHRHREPAAGSGERGRAGSLLLGGAVSTRDSARLPVPPPLAPHPGREHPWVLPPNFCPSAAAVPRMHRHPDTPTHGHPDTPTHGHTDTPTSRHADIPTHGHTDSPTPPPPRHTPPGARSLSVPVLVQPGGQPLWGEASPACSPPPPPGAGAGRAGPGRTCPGGAAAPRAPRAGTGGSPGAPSWRAGGGATAVGWALVPSVFSAAPPQGKKQVIPGSSIISHGRLRHFLPLLNFFPRSPRKRARERHPEHAAAARGGLSLLPPGSLFITRWPQLARAKARDGASKATPTTLGGLETAKCAELPRRHGFAIQTNTRIFTHTCICIYMYTKRYCIGINHL